MSLIFPQPGSIVPVYIGAWAGKPAAGTAGVGSVIQVTDVGVGSRSYWFSDGTRWRPVNSSVLLFAAAGSLTTPNATITLNGSNQRFTLSSYTIPSGMVFAGSKLHAKVSVRRAAAAGIAGSLVVGLTNSDTTIGTANAFIVRSLPATADLSINADGSIYFRNTSSGQNGTDYLVPPDGAVVTGQNSILGLSTTSAMYFVIGAVTATVDDLELYQYQLWLEG